VVDQESSLDRVVVNWRPLISQTILPMVQLIRCGCGCSCVLDFVLMSKVSDFGELELGSVVVDLDMWELR
ncbi:hypothetical protein HAX54_023479, partial [Datura stramonium]|nr:hypothetical protein [Datura stramonium]